MRIVNARPWPSGKEQALLALEGTVGAWRNRGGIQFGRSEDGLGYLYEAFAELASGTLVRLSWHAARPSDGVSIVIDSGAPAMPAVRELIDALELQAADVRWVSPRVLWS